MPIYEYLCPPCNRVYSFLARSLTPARQPACPKCGCRDLRRRLSRFAVVGRARAPAGTDGGGPGSADTEGRRTGADPLDDPRVEREMEHLMQAAEGADENDPRQLGRLMRRMSELTGEKLDQPMEEALRRLESGEDPDRIEDDMGDLLGGGEAEAEGGPAGGAPSYDPGLYTM